jgi:tripartite ATP-independent transporter DctP family solute receptor
MAKRDRITLKMAWKSFQVALVISLMPVLVGSFAYGATKPIIIKLAYVHVPENPSAVSSQRFAKLVEERSQGRVKVEVYPGGQLGQQPEVFGGLAVGSIEMSNMSTSAIAQFCPEMGVWDLPYLFRDSAHAYSVLDGPIGKRVTENCMKKSGVRNLAYTENGWRHFTNRIRPITKPDDLKGLKIRSITAPMMVETIRALGANPVPVAWGEVYMALQQGVADGQENPHNNTYGAKLYEVQKYVSLSAHVYNPMGHLIGEKLFQSLPPDIRKILEDASQESAVYSREQAVQIEVDCLKKLLEKGMTVNTPPDLSLFKTKSRPVYDKFAGEVGGWALINEIVNAK